MVEIQGFHYTTNFQRKVMKFYRCAYNRLFLGKEKKNLDFRPAMCRRLN